MHHDPIPNQPDRDRDELATTLHTVYDIFGVDGEFRPNTRNFCQYAYRKYAFGHPLPDGEDWSFYANIQPVYAANVTRALRQAVDILAQDFGVDLLNDRNALSDPAKFKHVIDGLRDQVGDTGKLYETTEENMPYIFASSIAQLFGGSKSMFMGGIDTTRKLKPEIEHATNIQIIRAAQLDYYQATADNISRMRYDTQRQLRYLCGEEVATLLDYTDEVIAERNASNETINAGAATDDNTEARHILESKKQELNFVLLPPGELREAAEKIARGSTEHEQARVDLNRLKVLEDLRQTIGADRCYFVCGKKTDKYLPDEDGRLISEDYIGLVIQQLDDDGVASDQACIAISPIAQKHAGYITRNDASAGISWREIFSMPKSDALNYFNARRLRFDPVSGEDKYTAYVKKVQTLLACPAEQFADKSYVLHRTGDAYTMRHRGKPIGHFAATITLEALQREA